MVCLKMRSSANFVEAQKAWRQKVEAQIFFLEAQNSDCLRLVSSDFLFHLSIKGFKKIFKLNKTGSEIGF